MLVFNVVFVTCISLFAYCDAGFVDTLSKCSVKDDECMRSLYQNAIHNIGKTGISELNIPPIDPIHLINFTVTVLDSIKITMDDGTAKGISKCEFTSFHIDLEKQTGAHEIICDLIIKGHISVAGSSPMAQSFFGRSNIHGEGKGKVRLEKLYLNIEFPFHPIKKEDGETYLKISTKKPKYEYNVKKASFAAEKIFIGKDDISRIVVSYLNENWPGIMKNYGRVFIDKSMEIYTEFATKFFEGIPTKNYLIEDLTPYVKK